MSCEQWDVSCGVKHKDHHHVGLFTYFMGYTLRYACNIHGDYFGIFMFIKHKFQPKVIV